MKKIFFLILLSSCGNFQKRPVILKTQVLISNPNNKLNLDSALFQKKLLIQRFYELRKDPYTGKSNSTLCKDSDHIGNFSEKILTSKNFYFKTNIFFDSSANLNDCSMQEDALLGKVYLVRCKDRLVTAYTLSEIPENNLDSLCQIN